MFKSNALNSLFSIIVIAATIGYVAYCLYNAIDIIGTTDVIGAGFVRLAFYNRDSQFFDDYVAIHSHPRGVNTVASSDDGHVWIIPDGKRLFDALVSRYGLGSTTDANIAIHRMGWEDQIWVSDWAKDGEISAQYIIPAIEKQLRAERVFVEQQKGWVYSVDNMDVVEGHSAEELEMLGLSIRSVQADSYDTDDDYWT